MSDATSLQAFQTAISAATAAGAKYQPTNSILDLGKLQQAFTDAHAGLDDLNTIHIAEKLVINDREAGFIGSGVLATRLQAAVATSGASAQDLADMKGFVRKVHGGRKKKLKIDDPNTPVDESKHISVSQRGYSDVVEHYENIIALLTGLGAAYKVNEVDLQIASVQTMVDGWAALNQSVIDAGIATSNARTVKNGRIYNDDDSLYERLRLMKFYFNQVFGSKSPEYKQISGLEIKKHGK